MFCLPRYGDPSCARNIPVSEARSTREWFRWPLLGVEGVTASRQAGGGLELSDFSVAFNLQYKSIRTNILNTFASPHKLHPCKTSCSLMWILDLALLGCLSPLRSIVGPM